MGKPGEYDKSTRYPVLWLVHGGGQTHSAWPLEARIKDKGTEAQIIIVMATVRDVLSMVSGADYFKFMAEELPEFIGFLFPTSRKREDNYIAGLSYGGYFSYRTALNYPDNYACVGSFSSPLDPAMDIKRLHPEGSTDFCKYYEIAGTNRDILSLATKLKESGREIPKMFQAVGTEDFTWDFNISARERFLSLGLDHTWVQGPGSHNFDFWDPILKQFVDWLPLKNRSAAQKEGS
jgi:S-formylglutathione hydrolase FrmB